ncbi:MAG: dihydrodipicolinate synthase family protein [Actinobacteria bacterium]|nr:dihydrodipicolinate synthase family protein [Actinomycetota bacterium]
MLRGAIAAVVTPLTGSGQAVDEPAIGPVVHSLSEGGIDGVLVCGTTGEGILLTPAERRAVAARFVDERPAGFQVAVHAGAQTTADTVALAAHASEIGADAVAVIAPPYFPLGEEELVAHLRAAAEACAPVPFYVYEFAGRSGYTIPVAAIERIRELATNLAGMKVSDTPFSAVEPYALEGLDLFVGSEPLVLEGMRKGAVGAVSGLATAFPEIVASLVHDRSDRAGKQVTTLRRLLGPLPFHAALKTIMHARSVPVLPDVRAPLRGLSDDERVQALDAARAVGVEVASFDQAEV